MKLDREDRKQIKILLDACFHLNQIGHRNELTGGSVMTNKEVKQQMMGMCPACEIDERLEAIAAMVGVKLL